MGLGIGRQSARLVFSSGSFGGSAEQDDLLYDNFSSQHFALPSGFFFSLCVSLFPPPFSPMLGQVLSPLQLLCSCLLAWIGYQYYQQRQRLRTMPPLVPGVVFSSFFFWARPRSAIEKGEEELLLVTLDDALSV